MRDRGQDRARERQRQVRGGTTNSEGVHQLVKHIAIGQILQETNTLNPVLTQRADFEAYGLVQGEGVVE